MESEFHEQLERYQGYSQSAIELRHKVATLEIARAEWIASMATRLIAEGNPNPRTQKPFSWNAAHEYARDMEEHRTQQREIARLEAQAGTVELRARATWVGMRWFIVCRERVIA